MLIEETNDLIRECINNMIESGWLKTHIGKILLGPNGQAHLNHFLKSEDNDLPNNFGIKPLQKIGQVINFDAHVVFIHPDDTKRLMEVNEANQEFVAELAKQITDYLGDNTRKVNIPKGKSQIDSVLDDLLPE